MIKIFFLKKNLKFNFYNNFVIYVGSRKAYKNFTLFIKSFAEIKDKNLNLVLFGGGPLDNSEKKLIKHLNLKNRVFYETGDDPKLSNLYNSAKFLIYPSLYEGFGLPVIEAMSCGCPVIAGNHSSIIEIAKDAALLIDVSNKNTIKDAMNELLENKEKRLAFSKKGLERSKYFSWEKCAKKTFDIYKNLILK